MKAVSPQAGGARRAVWLVVFAASMGLLEAAVVVYLRELIYPDGFRFPLVPLPKRIAIVEIVRELTTILMLLAVAALAGRSRIDRFFVFAFAFGVWDLVYYGGLYAFLGWPESLLAWDVLFLIPVPWLGPVIYPAVVSALLIASFIVHERLRATGRPLRPSSAEWALAMAGGVLVIVAFCWHWRTALEGSEPERFPLEIFAAGVGGAILAFARATARALREPPHAPHPRG